jgi:hypothetical protein
MALGIKARYVGVGAQAVTDWFAGRRTPTSEQILAIQEFLREPRLTGKRPRPKTG